MEFDGVSGVLPRSDPFNGNGFTFGEPPWRSAKLHISNGATSSSDEKVIRHSFLWWMLWWYRRQVTVLVSSSNMFCYLFSFVMSLFT